MRVFQEGIYLSAPDDGLWNILFSLKLLVEEEVNFTFDHVNHDSDNSVEFFFHWLRYNFGIFSSYQKLSCFEVKSDKSFVSFVGPTPHFRSQYSDRNTLTLCFIDLDGELVFAIEG